MKVSKQLLTILVLLITLNACSPTINYLGKSYVSTTNVDLYFDREDVPRPFEVMGHAEVILSNLFTMQEGQKALEKYAIKAGADAIVFEGINTNSSPTYTKVEDSKANSSGGYTTTSTVSTSNNETKIIKAILVKYK